MEKAQRDACETKFLQGVISVETEQKGVGENSAEVIREFVGINFDI